MHNAALQQFIECVKWRQTQYWHQLNQFDIGIRIEFQNFNFENLIKLSITVTVLRIILNDAAEVASSNNS